MDTWCFWNPEHTFGVEVSWQKAQLNTENGKLHVRDECALFDMKPFISILAAPTQTRYTLNRNCLVAHTGIHRTAKMSLLVGQVSFPHHVTSSCYWSRRILTTVGGRPNPEIVFLSRRFRWMLFLPKERHSVAVDLTPDWEADTLLN